MSSCSRLVALLSISVLLLGTVCECKAHRYLYRRDGVINFLLEAKASIAVTYPTSAGPKKANIDVPAAPEGGSVLVEQSTISNERGQIEGLVTNISWADYNFTLQVSNHANYDKKEWMVSGMVFAYNSTPPILDSTPRTGVVSQVLPLYKTDFYRPYQCHKATFVLYGSQWSNATVTFEGFKLQAFLFNNNTFGDSPQMCVSPLADASSILLPVVIGAALLLLALLAIATYILGCWCTRKKKSAYTRML